MPSTLNPSEVDALMDAIQQGDVPVGTAAPAAPAVEAVEYDLTSQDRIIRGQLPTLDSMNDTIASTFASSLTGRMRTQVRVNSNPSSLLKFVDFNALLAPTATVVVFTLGPAYGAAVCVLETGLAEAILAGALGDKQARGESPDVNGKRELTQIERLVLKRILGLFTNAMRSTWGPLLPISPEVMRFESDPRLAVIAPPNEVAILSSFELAGAIEGTMQLGIPYSTVESVKKQLSQPPRAAMSSDKRFTRALKRELNEVPIETIAQLGESEISLQKLLQLKVGDILKLDSDERTELPLQIEGRSKLYGMPKVINSSMGMQITQGLTAPFGDDGTDLA